MTLALTGLGTIGPKTSRGTNNGARFTKETAAPPPQKLLPAGKAVVPAPETPAAVPPAAPATVPKTPSAPKATAPVATPEGIPTTEPVTAQTPAAPHAAPATAPRAPASAKPTPATSVTPKQKAQVKPKTPREQAAQRGRELMKTLKNEGVGQGAGRSGGHGTPHKRAGAELIRQANLLPKNDPNA